MVSWKMMREKRATHAGAEQSRIIARALPLFCTETWKQMMNAVTKTTPKKIMHPRSRALGLRPPLTRACTMKHMPEMSMRQNATDEGSMPSAKQMRDTGPRRAHASAAVTQ
jgi:hypothetical protein